MNKTKTFIFLLFFSALLYLAFNFKNQHDENTVAKCINDVIKTLEIHSIKYDISNRIQSPIISGKTNNSKKNQFIKLISSQCKINTFEDFIEVTYEDSVKTAAINFKLDSVNNIATITGIVNNNIEQQEVLSSFTTAVNEHYGPWTIKHEILVSELASKNEFAIDITLTFTAISLVKLTDISFANNQIIIKGLVRNKLKEEQTISQLNQIFQGETEIINKLKPVITEGPDFDGLDTKPPQMELPKLTPPVT